MDTVAQDLKDDCGCRERLLVLRQRVLIGVEQRDVWYLAGAQGVVGTPHSGSDGRQLSPSDRVACADKLGEVPDPEPATALDFNLLGLHVVPGPRRLHATQVRSRARTMASSLGCSSG
jgi:hypothetical protein